MKKTLGIFVFEAVELGKFVSRDLGGNTLQLIFVKGAGKNPTLEKKLKVDLSLSLFFSFYAYNPMHIGYLVRIYIQIPDILPDILFQYNISHMLPVGNLQKLIWNAKPEKNFRKFQLDPYLRHPTFSTSGGTGFTFLAEKNDIREWMSTTHPRRKSFHLP